MKPEIRHVGNSHSPVVVIDGLSGAVDRIGAIADALGPFPQITNNFYPGVRRHIFPSDVDAYDYATRVCRAAAPFVGGAFDVDNFDLTEASFSIVTLKPNELQPAQRIPHFDSTDQNLIAMLHFLRVPAGSGTAFYRHRATGIERITDENSAEYLNTIEIDVARLTPDSGYINDSNEFWEQIDMVEAVPDRLIMYPGSLLHSGVIPPGTTFSADPRQGRLTSNYFLVGHRGAKRDG